MRMWMGGIDLMSDRGGSLRKLVSHMGRLGDRRGADADTSEGIERFDVIGWSLYFI